MMVSFIKENTYFASYPYEVFLYLKYQQSTKSCACDKSHWQNILRVCQRVRERSHASPDMACNKVYRAIKISFLSMFQLVQKFVYTSKKNIHMANSIFLPR